MHDVISRQVAIDALDEIESEVADGYGYQYEKWRKYFCGLPPAQPEIIWCRDCKHNPKDTWLECPMSHLTEKQRPETAWCWKGERRTDERPDR